MVVGSLLSITSFVYDVINNSFAALHEFALGTADIYLFVSVICLLYAHGKRLLFNTMAAGQNICSLCGAYCYKMALNNLMLRGEQRQCCTDEEPPVKRSLNCIFPGFC